jgi:hypothetical protein
MADYSVVSGGVGNAAGGEDSNVGGGRGNVISSNGWRGTVSGGVFNTVDATEGTVGGGGFNSARAYSATIGGGGGNAASGEWSTIAGGRDNLLTNAHYATIGGGRLHAIESNAWDAVIAGGIANRIEADAADATIGGGWENRIGSGSLGATIPGGVSNTVTAPKGFAAGFRAKANHAGSFVWADSTEADLATTSANQFLVRASGGVAVNTNNPGGAALFVNGNLKVTGQIESADQLNLISGGTNVLRIVALNDPGNGITANSRGGSPANVISNGVYGGFIGGGGNASFPNRVGGSYASVLGGSGNLAMGLNSTAMGEFSTASGRASVAMGRGVVASADSALAMGESTLSRGWSSTAMGYLTKATNDNATAMGQGSIAGGWDSTAMGTYAVASANYSMAAGYYPQANHPGCFVWADSTSLTPFASTASNQFLIRASGGVGIGTGSPQAPLHVWGSAIVNGADRWDVNNTEGDLRVGSATHRFKIGVAQGGGGAGDVWMRAQGGTARLFVKTPGGTTFYSNEGQTNGVTLAPGGGSWTSVSDRHAKENFAAVDPAEVLSKVAALPLSTWNYKSQDAAIRHLGPVAQDFKAVFGLGETDTGITTVDADGVALAAIQGLNQKLEQKETEIAELKQSLNELKELLHAVNQKLNGGAQ